MPDKTWASGDENLQTLTQVLKKLWNLKMIMIPVVAGVIGTVTKNLKKDSMNLRLEEELKLYRLQQS